MWRVGGGENGEGGGGGGQGQATWCGVTWHMSPLLLAFPCSKEEGGGLKPWGKLPQTAAL